ncbi:MAG TPA: hypothetical protein VFG10_09230 [Saprospiraceae bacterium]|nr:hypothetical protein [Saprospiraceae bacterium]
MQTHFVCLANSLKEGGRCIAGIELDMHNKPVFYDGKPKWIRPVCNTEHGEVPIHIAFPFDLLDIIKLDVIESKPSHFQTENVNFNMNTIEKVGSFDQNELKHLCDDRISLFGNRGKAVSQESIHNLNHSLALLSVNNFSVFEKIYPDKPNRPQIRISFEYNGSIYDVPVTDPMFRDKFAMNKNILKDIKQVYLCTSLGILWEGWYHKLCAGIIY